MRTEVNGRTAMVKQTPAGEKGEQFQRWFSSKELGQLNQLSGKSEVVKVNNIFPNLYTQMSYSMSDIADSKEKMISELENLMDTSGDFAADALIKSIYSDFVSEFEPFSDDQELPEVTRKAYQDFAIHTFDKIEAAQKLRTIYALFKRIDTFKERVELANKGVLL